MRTDWIYQVNAFTTEKEKGNKFEKLMKRFFDIAAVVVTAAVWLPLLLV